MKAKKGLLSLAITTVLSMGVLLAGCGDSTSTTGSDEGAQGTVDLSYGTYISSGHYQGKLDQQMFERIEEQTEGTLAVNKFFDGTLVNSREWYQEVLRGSAEIVQAAVGSEKDRFPLEYSVGLFNYGITDLGHLLEFTRELVEQTPELAEEYEEVVPLNRMSAGQSWIHTVSKPVRSVEDFRGMNIKVADEASVELVRALGANPINLPISETYSALEKGTIDGVVTGADPLRTFNFAEVTKYSTRLPYATPWQNSKMMNKEVFNNLSSEQQKVLIENARWWEEQLIVELEKEVQAGVDLAIEEGNEIIDLSEDVTNEILAVMEENAKAAAEALDAKGLNGTELFNNARLIADKFTD
ncbi:TRAP transporter substrate-binding protein [Halalkalibacter krulwichiae]|uniref:Lactate-binding periplasmic protein n=1 Tax=Halalkalibacter krulwichiae TaxID=199441 RepID=A0A1X9M970_9BACI|nr:TRAP transporter substrate-binding protein DctP [Halalkalibacter krulwichiae]ARK29937.1 Lactate-binding periplasmic protein precursor [Halalkalibacter krulwichiae]